MVAEQRDSSDVINPAIFPELRAYVQQVESRLRRDLAAQIQASERRLRAELTGPLATQRFHSTIAGHDAFRAVSPTKPPTETEIESLVEVCVRYSRCRNISRQQLRIILRALLPKFTESQVDILVAALGASDGVDWQYVVRWLIHGKTTPVGGVLLTASIQNEQDKIQEVTTAAPSSYEEAFEQAGGQSMVDEAKQLVNDLQQKDAALDKEIRDLLPEEFSKRRGYSTRLVSQHFVSDLDTLLHQAEKVLDSFQAKIQELAQRTGGQPYLAPRKERTRARIKAMHKYGDSSSGIAYYRLTDLVRASISYKDISKMYVGLKVIAEESGDKLKEVNDRYQQPLPGGYRDLQLILEHKEHMCELQLTTDPVIAVLQMRGHRRWQVLRELEVAVNEGSLEKCIQVLEWGQKQFGSKANDDFFGQEDAAFLLHAAAQKGHAEIVNFFLRHGAGANVQDEHGNTPLHYAMQHGHERVVWALLDQGGTDHRILNKEKRSPLLLGYLMLKQQPKEEAVRAFATLAQWSGADYVFQVKQQVDEELKKMWHNSRHIVGLAADGRAREVKVELQNFADPNSRDADGIPALIAAAAEGHLEVVELLLGFRASPLVKDRYERSALDAAYQRQHNDVMSKLLAAGAKPRSMIADRIDTGKSGFAHIVAANNGKLYCGAWDSSSMLVFDPTTGAMKFLETGQEGKSKWAGVAVGGDGRLYCAPHNHSALMIVDPVSEAIKLVEVGVLGDSKWDGVAAAPDGRLFCCPLDSQDVLIFDPATGIVKYIDTQVDGDRKWNGIACAKDGKLYCAPYNHSTILIIDPVTEMVQFVETGVVGDRKWAGITAGPDGRLYCAPCNSSVVLAYDPATESISFVASGVKGKLKWAGIATGADGRLYCAPLKSSAILILNPATEAVQVVETLVPNGYIGIAAGSDGRLYCRHSDIPVCFDLGIPRHP